MSHMIEERMVNGVLTHSFAENGANEIAWHGLGQRFDRPMTVVEALEASHADYKVTMRPIVALTDELEKAMNNKEFISAESLKKFIIDGKMSTMRTDCNEVLGVVSNTYGIVQNEDAFRFIDTLCSGKIEGDTPLIESCGVLGHGERVFITAKFPKQIVVNAKRDDLIDLYAVFTTSHDGTGAVRCMITPVRVVCNNTLQFALKNNIGMASFRHTVNVNKRMDLTNKENAQFAYKTLNIYELYTEAFKDTLHKLEQTTFTEEQVDRILASISLSPESFKVFDETKNIMHEDIKTRGRNIFIGMKNALHSAVGQDIIESGNGMWLMNGITSFYQNVANFKDTETKFISLTEGNVSNKVNKALMLCLNKDMALAS